MCLIIASPTGRRISDTILEDAARSNAHGAGLAWSETKDKKIQFRKGLTVEQVKKLLDTDAKDKPWVVHFRIATHGPVCDELTHPFTIDEHASIATSGEADSVFFQNGTFASWKEYLLQASANSGIPVPEPPWSDSRGIAFCLNVYGKHLLSLLDNHSRFLVFDAKDKSENRIMLWGDWHDYEDFKFSNRSTSAFNSSWNHNSSSSAGGSSTNPTQRAASTNAAAASETDEGTEGPTETPSRTPDTNSTSPRNSAAASPSGTSLATSRETRTVRKFTPRSSHNVWRSFTDAGIYVKADNEAAPTA